MEDQQCLREGVLPGFDRALDAGSSSPNGRSSADWATLAHLAGSVVAHENTKSRCGVRAGKLVRLLLQPPRWAWLRFRSSMASGLTCPAGGCWRRRSSAPRPPCWDGLGEKCRARIAGAQGKHVADLGPTCHALGWFWVRRDHLAKTFHAHRLVAQQRHQGVAAGVAARTFSISPQFVCGRGGAAASTSARPPPRCC